MAGLDLLGWREIVGEEIYARLRSKVQSCLHRGRVRSHHHRILDLLVQRREQRGLYLTLHSRDNRDRLEYC